MLLVSASLAFFVLVASVAAERATFENYRVHTVDVANEQQLEKLRQLDHAELGGIEFWKSPTGVGKSADVMVAPHQAAAFAELMKEMEITTRVMVNDVQK